MEQAELQQLIEQTTAWVIEAGERLRTGVDHIQTVSQKQSRNDLVTNEDQQIEAFLETKIKAAYPNAKLFGEENPDARPSTLDGLVFFIDPIDGTLNFVRKHDCFASMLAVYQDGEPLLGIILDVMTNDLYWGGPSLGVYRNGTKLPYITDNPLAKGLVGASWRQLFTNRFNLGEVGYKSSGIRILGSAGLEFVQLLNNRHVGYISTLNPWDFAAGKILAEELGFETGTVSGQKLNLAATNDFIVMTPTAMRESRTILY